MPASRHRPRCWSSTTRTPLRQDRAADDRQQHLRVRNVSMPERPGMLKASTEEHHVEGLAAQRSRQPAPSAAPNLRLRHSERDFDVAIEGSTIRRCTWLKVAAYSNISGSRTPLAPAQRHAAARACRRQRCAPAGGQRRNRCAQPAEHGAAGAGGVNGRRIRRIVEVIRGAGRMDATCATKRCIAPCRCGPRASRRGRRRPHPAGAPDDHYRRR